MSLLTTKQKLIDRLFAVVENRPEPWHTFKHYKKFPNGEIELFYSCEQEGLCRDVVIITSTDTKLRGGAAIIEVHPKVLEPIYRAAFDEFEAKY